MERRTKRIKANRILKWSPKDVSELIRHHFTLGSTLEQIKSATGRTDKEILNMIRAITGLPVIEHEEVTKRESEKLALILFISECKSTMWMDIAITRLKKLEEQPTQ